VRSSRFAQTASAHIAEVCLSAVDRMAAGTLHLQRGEPVDRPGRRPRPLLEFPQLLQVREPALAALTAVHMELEGDTLGEPDVSVEQHGERVASFLTVQGTKSPSALARHHTPERTGRSRYGPEATHNPKVASASESRSLVPVNQCSRVDLPAIAVVSAFAEEFRNGRIAAAAPGMTKTSDL